ncbi:MAG TPA: hypothetical protein VFG69_16220 [Nannocystaceae bacterium]|nr:hypothetical protein [Nannocystaceae bacterium]
MSERHADDATLAAFVRGEIGDAGFAAHMLDCAACAGRLAAAARLEVAMHEAAEAMAQPIRMEIPPPRPVPARRNWASELALAASLVLGIGMPSRWLDAETSEIAVATERGMTTPDTTIAACTLPDEGRSCDAPAEPWLDEALAMTTMDPPVGLDELGEDRLCEPAIDGSDLVCPAEI